MVVDGNCSNPEPGQLRALDRIPGCCEEGRGILRSDRGSAGYDSNSQAGNITDLHLIQFRSLFKNCI